MATVLLSNAKYNGVSPGSVHTVLPGILRMSKQEGSLKFWYQSTRFFSLCQVSAFQANPENFYYRLVTQDET